VVSNKNPRCRMVSVPREYISLIEQEMNTKGYFSYPQVMDDILSQHFKGKKPEAGKDKSIVKGVVRDEKNR